MRVYKINNLYTACVSRFYNNKNVIKNFVSKESQNRNKNNVSFSFLFFFFIRLYVSSRARCAISVCIAHAFETYITVFYALEDNILF